MRTKCASDVPFPETLPNGPWLSAESAKAELDAWCQNVAVCGGGWGTSWINSRQANSSRGVQRVLGCHLKTRHVCKWQLTLEETTAGWVVYSLTDEHTHELTQSLAESNSYAGMRAIPPDYHDLVRVLAAAGQSAAAIFRVLESKASRDGVPVTFTRQDVYTFSGATTAEKVFDATGLLEKLNERHKVQGLPFHFESDEEGRLSRVFIVLCADGRSYAKLERNISKKGRKDVAGKVERNISNRPASGAVPPPLPLRARRATEAYAPHNRCAACAAPLCSPGLLPWACGGPRSARARVRFRYSVAGTSRLNGAVRAAIGPSARFGASRLLLQLACR